MNTEILIVSCAKHFNHLQYALRSIQKFARGFSACRIVIPRVDMGKFDDMVLAFPPDFKNGFPIIVDGFDEWPDKGMVHHMHIIMHSDQYCPDADFVLHFDSDCVFTELVTPEDYFFNCKPVLMYADFGWLCTQVQGNLIMWQEAALNAIGPPIEIETMRRHPAVHYRELYPLARDAMEKHTGKGVVEFMMERRNTFPQDFCEYVTLGNVAHRTMRDKYHWIDQRTQGFPPSKLNQSWSHADPSPENMELYRKLGLV